MKIEANMNHEKMITQQKPVHIIALSGGTANALRYFIHDTDMDRISYINAMCRAHYPENVEYVPFQLLDKDKDRNGQFAENADKLRELPYHIWQLFHRDEHFILLVSLGGVQGSLLAKKIYYYLVDHQKSFNIIGSMPFRFEAPCNTARAKSVAREFRFDPRITLFHLNELGRRYGNMKLSVAFRNADLEFYYYFKEQMLSPA